MFHHIMRSVLYNEIYPKWRSGTLTLRSALTKCISGMVTSSIAHSSTRKCFKAMLCLKEKQYKAIIFGGQCRQPYTTIQPKKCCFEHHIVQRVKEGVVHLVWAFDSDQLRFLFGVQIFCHLGNRIIYWRLVNKFSVG